MLNVSKTENDANRYPPKINAVDSFSVAADNSSIEGVDTCASTSKNVRTPEENACTADYT